MLELVFSQAPASSGSALTESGNSIRPVMRRTENMRTLTKRRVQANIRMLTRAAAHPRLPLVHQQLSLRVVLPLNTSFR